MKEKILQLYDAVISRPNDQEYIEEDVDFIGRKLGSFTDYFNAVFKDVMCMESNRRLRDAGRISQEEFSFRIQSSDETRRHVHDAAISACSALNRMCAEHGIEPLFPDPADHDRTQIAEFIGRFVYNVYEDGIGEHTLDQSISDARDVHKNPDRAYDRPPLDALLKDASERSLQTAKGAGGMQKEEERIEK